MYFGSWLNICLFGLVVFSFINEKAMDLTRVINTLYILPPVSVEILIKAYMLYLPFAYVCMFFFYGALVFTTAFEPISATVCNYGFIRQSNLFCSPLKILVGIYQVWNFSVIVGIGCVVVYHGLFCSYLAIWRLTRDMQIYSLHYMYIPLLRQFRKYRHLQLYTGIVNDCFQEKLALQFLMVFVFLTILFGTIILHPSFRSMAEIEAIAVGVYTLAMMYTFLMIGYYFPGEIYQISKRVLGLQYHTITTRRYARVLQKEYRAVARACQPLKIRFGSVSYYEEGTVLVIIHFIIEKTSTFILLF